MVQESPVTKHRYHVVLSHDVGGERLDEIIGQYPGHDPDEVLLRYLQHWSHQLAGIAAQVFASRIVDGLLEAFAEPGTPIVRCTLDADLDDDVHALRLLERFEEAKCSHMSIRFLPEDDA